MVFSGKSYYDVFRILLMAYGLWPYQTPKVVQTAFFFGLYSFFLFFQCTTFLTATCDLEFIFRAFAYIFITIMFIVLYNSAYFNGKEIKQMLEQIELDWNTIEDISEFKILEKYALEVRLFLIFLSVLVVVATFTLVILENVPVFLDIIAPINESRPRQLKVDFELFIDKERYFYFYLTCEVVMIFIGGFTLVSAGSVPVTVLRHCCATCKIASSLIESSVTKHTLQIPAQQKAYVMYKKINRAVRIHRKTIRFSEFFVHALNKSYFMLASVCVVSLSCNLFRLLYAATVLHDFSELILSFGLVLVHFVILFVPNYIGQTFIDHNSEIFYAAYNTMWYLAPLPIQKLLLFLMQYSLKAHSLIFFNIYVSSLEGFSTVATSSISYFTVMYSMTTK